MTHVSPWAMSACVDVFFILVKKEDSKLAPNHNKALLQDGSLPPMRCMCVGSDESAFRILKRQDLKSASDSVTGTEPSAIELIFSATSLPL